MKKETKLRFHKTLTERCKKEKVLLKGEKIMFRQGANKHGVKFCDYYFVDRKKKIENFITAQGVENAFWQMSIRFSEVF